MNILPNFDSSRICKSFKNAFQTWFRDVGGNVAMVTAIVLPVLAGAGALAVDYSRVSSARSQMASALDSALLATAIELQARDMSDEEAKKYLQTFFDANTSLMGLDVEVELESISIDWDTDEVSAKVKTDLPMLMAPVVGKDNMQIVVGGSAVFGVDRTEVAMTFDITGSMSGSKLTSLKTAAKSGINKLLAGNTPSRKHVKIAVVPYADAVNSGAIFKSLEGNGTKLPDGCKTERPGKFLYTDDGPGKGPPFRDSRLGYCPDAIIQPLTADEAALEAAVNGMEANGFTAGHIGIQWAWYMISPNWGPYLPSGSEPSAYSGDVNKIAIIMTDGLFNTAFAGVPGSESPRGQAAKSQSYALKICENMREKGIKVFTIGFALKDKTATDLMKECASPSDETFEYFYQANDGTELVDVYEQIARRIKTIRVSK